MKSRNPSPLQSRKTSVKIRLQYEFDNLMARGGIGIFIGLIGTIVLSLIIIFMLRVGVAFFFPDETLPKVSGMFWRALLQIIDAGGIEADEGSHLFNKIIGVISVSMGLVFFSALVAFISNQFNRKLESLRKGKSEVIEKGHTLILGFTPQIIEIAEQLIIINRSFRERKAIVILARSGKIEMDDYLSEQIKYRPNARIITRSGDTCDTKLIKKMSINQAGTIIILNHANVADPPRLRDESDAKVLESIIAVVSAAGDEHLPPVVAQLHADQMSKLAENIAPGKIITINTNSILANILVCTSLNPGLAFVYSNLVGFDSSRIVLHRPVETWKGHTFGKLQFHFITSILVGFRTMDGDTILNPPVDFIPTDDDEGIFLVPAKDKLRFYKKQVILPAEQQFFMTKSRIVIEHQLIIGWNSKVASMLKIYAEVMREGSSIDIIVKEPSPIIKREVKALQELYKSIMIHLLDGDIHDLQFLTELSPQKYTSILILAEESDSSEAVDLKSISRLSELRHFFQNSENTAGVSTQPNLVTEVINSEKADIFFQAGAKDFLIPHKFVSEIVAQISQDPDLKQIYDEIFKQEGSEVHLKPAELYFHHLPIKASFADCMLAAQTRGEVCLGVKIGAFVSDVQQNFGLYLPPQKNHVFDLCESDALVTLAENRN